MQDMVDFFNYFLFQGVPAFLISKPIVYFTGVACGLCVLALVKKLFGLGR